MDKVKYKKIFMEESREHVKNLGDGFVSLEKEPGNLDCVDELFRHAHSMKGMAGSMGYDGIAVLSHAMEDVLDLVKKRELKVEPGIVDLLFSSLDRMEKMIGEADADDRISTRATDLVEKLRSFVKPAGDYKEDVREEDLIEVSPEELIPLEEAGPTGPVAPLPAKLSGLTDRLDEGRIKMLNELLGSDLNPYFVEIGLDEDSPAPAARDFIILNLLSKAGVLVASMPDIEEVRKGKASTTIEALILFSGKRDDLLKMISDVPEILSVQAESLDRAALAAGGEEEKPPPEPPLRKGSAIKAGKSQTVRVDTVILDKLINIVGEMLISQERLRTLEAGGDRETLHDEISLLGGLIRRFQETIMDVRMMPLDFVAGRYPRMVRDLSRKAGKEVSFDVEGLEIELDRAILEEIGEVLVHVLRNAVDHGMEKGDEREKKGKPKTGSIRFKAYREKDWVFIQISDDGRGIDLEAVRAKALEVGLVSPEVLEGMDEEEIMMLTTAPGFSTAKEVTDISGRGVGLDAVRAKVESLGGSLSIYSSAGKGTNVTIRIPLSLAIVQILVVRVDKQFFGLPIAGIHNTEEITPDMVKKTGDQEYFRSGRSLVRLNRMSELMGIKKRGKARCSGPVVIVEKGRRKLGFLVDELLGTRDAVVKALGQPLVRIPAFTGATILGDGSPMIILDVLKLLS